VEPGKSNVRDALALARKNENVVKAFKIRLGYTRAFADDPSYEKLYDYAEAMEVPVMFHTGDTADPQGSLVRAHPLTLDALANERKGMKIVACHFGNPWIDDAAELIYKHENVYADISGLIAGSGGKYGSEYVDLLAERLSRAIYFAGGTEKVLFGTDYPVVDYSRALNLVERLKIQEEDKLKLLTNAGRLFQV
jgi:uncharacterized protein